MGVTGCNFGVAETGSVVLVENEGNGRLSSTVPRIHVAVMGMERVVDTWDQLDLMINLLARSGTGQHISTYTNIVTGPRREGEADGPDELHVVILDNGRSEVLGTELQEILELHPLRRLPQRVPRLPPGRRARLRVGVQRTGRGGAHAAAGRATTPRPPSCPTPRRSAVPAWTPARSSIPLQDLLLTLRRRNAAAEGRGEHAGWSAWAAAWSRPLTYRASLKAAALGRPLSRFAAMAPGLRAWGGGRVGAAARGPLVPAALEGRRPVSGVR